MSDKLLHDPEAMCLRAFVCIAIINEGFRISWPAELGRVESFNLKNNASETQRHATAASRLIRSNARSPKCAQKSRALLLTLTWKSASRTCRSQRLSFHGIIFPPLFAKTVKLVPPANPCHVDGTDSLLGALEQGDTP
jgi:hypothetical protein